MYRYYLTISPDTTTNQINNNDTPQMRPKLKEQEPKKKQAPSPKTLKKNISNENFIKYQWAWII